MHAVIIIHSQEPLRSDALYWKSLLPKLKVLLLGVPTDRAALLIQGDDSAVDDALRLVWNPLRDDLIQASIVRLNEPDWEAVDQTTQNGAAERLPIPDIIP